MTDPTNDMLERYLDGVLSAAERDQFDDQLAHDADLRKDLALQRRIDGSLSVLFRNDAQTESASPPASIPFSRHARPRSRRWLLAAAAALLVIAPGAWIVLNSQEPPTGHPSLDPPRQTLRQVYAGTVNAGFQPTEICTTPDAFEEWVQRNYQTALRPESEDPGVRFVGWSYSTLISPYTGVLLAHVEGEPVVVVLDKAKLERRETLEGEGPQQVFERRIGDLVLYEITPHDAPRVLPLLTLGS